MLHRVPCLYPRSLLVKVRCTDDKFTLNFSVGVVANQTTGRRRFKGVMMQAFHVNCASQDRSVIMGECTRACTHAHRVSKAQGVAFLGKWSFVCVSLLMSES